MQDHIREIKAGQGIQIEAAGVFVYCKYATQQFRLLIGGAPTDMQKGDLRREAQGFDGVHLENRSDKDIQVIVTIGHGEFDRKIVSGEITVRPGITTDTGEFVPDTRSAQRWAMNVGNGSVTHVGGDAVATGEDSNNSLVYRFQRDGLVYGVPYVTTPIDPNYCTDIILYDPVSGERLGTLDVGTPFAAGTRGHAYDRARDELYLLASDGKTCTRFSVASGGNWPSITFDPFTGIGTAAKGSLVGAFDGVLILHDQDRKFVVYDTNTDSGRLVDIPNITSLTYQTNYLSLYGWFSWDELNQVWLVAKSAGTGLYEVTPDFLNATLLRSQSYLEDGCPAGGNTAISAAVGVSADWEKVYIRDETQPAELVKAGTGGLVKRELVLTNADITAQRESDGTWKVTGEVIRAALRCLLGDVATIPSDYLDYIYRFEYTGTDGQQQIVDAGASSFAQLGIADNFKARAPSNISMTARRGLIS